LDVLDASVIVLCAHSLIKLKTAVLISLVSLIATDFSIIPHENVIKVKIYSNRQINEIESA